MAATVRKLTKESTIKLYNGVEMPVIVGTYLMKESEVEGALTEALSQGYRHIDTATVYRNEEAIGKTLQKLEHQYSRNNLFITSKLSPRDQGFESTIEAVNTSLQKLGTPYLDLYLIHWPGVQKVSSPASDEHAARRLQSWLALESLYRAGKLRAIGVSNFEPRHIEPLMKAVRPDSSPAVLPMVLQSEAHPTYVPTEAVLYCQKHNIAFTAYSSLGCGNLLQPDYLKKVALDAPLLAAASRTSKSIGQILLRWALQLGWIVIPKSVKPERVRENMELFDFELEEREIAEIGKLVLPLEQADPTKMTKFCWNPADIK